MELTERELQFVGTALEGYFQNGVRGTPDAIQQYLNYYYTIMGKIKQELARRAEAELQNGALDRVAVEAE